MHETHSQEDGGRGARLRGRGKRKGGGGAKGRERGANGEGGDTRTARRAPKKLAPVGQSHWRSTHKGVIFARCSAASAASWK